MAESFIAGWFVVIDEADGSHKAADMVRQSGCGPGGYL